MRWLKGAGLLPLAGCAPASQAPGASRPLCEDELDWRSPHYWEPHLKYLQSVFREQAASDRSRAEEFYRRARCAFDERDAEEAAGGCLWALYFNPDHLAAALIWLDVQPRLERNSPEIFILRSAVNPHAWRPPTIASDYAMHQAKVSYAAARFDETADRLEAARALLLRCPPSIETRVRMDEVEALLRLLEAIGSDGHRGGA